MEPDQRRSEGEGARQADGRAQVVEGTSSGEVDGRVRQVVVGPPTVDAKEEDMDRIDGGGDPVNPRQRVAPPESPGGGKEMRKKPPPTTTNGNDRKVPNGGPRATTPGVVAVPRGVGPDPAVAKVGATAKQGASTTKQRVILPRGPAAEDTPSEDSPVGLGSRMNQGAASVDVKQRPTARAAAPGAVAVSGPPPGGKVVDDSSATAPLGEARRVQRIAGPSSGPSNDDLLSPGDEGGGGISTTLGASGTGKPTVSSRATMPGVTSVSGKGPVKGGGIDPLTSNGRVRGTDVPPSEPDKSTERKVASTSSEGEELTRRVLVAPTEPPVRDESSPSSTSSHHSSAKPKGGERASTPGATAVAAKGVDGTGEDGGGRRGSPNGDDTRGVGGAPRVQKIVAPSMRPSDAAVAVGAAAAVTTSDAKPEVVERATAPGAVAVSSNRTNSRVAAKVASATNTPATSPTGKKVAASPDDSALKGVDGTRTTADGSQTKTEMSQERREQRIVAPSRPSDTAAMTISAGAMLATSPAKPEVVERATAPGAVVVAAATDERNDRATAKVASATGDAQRPRVQRVLSGRILPDATVDLEVDNRGKIPASSASASASASSSPTQSSTTTTGMDTKPKVQSRATAAGAVAVAGMGSASSSPSSSAASTGMGGGGGTDSKPHVRSRATAAGAVAVAGIGSAAAGGSTHGGTTAPEAAAAASRKRDDERVQRTAELRCPSDTAIGIQGGDGRETTATSVDADAKAKARAETKVRADAPGASSVGPTADAPVDEKIQAHGADREVGGGEAVVVPLSSESEEMERKRKEKIIAAARSLLNAGGADERAIQQTEAPLSDDAVLEKVGSAGAIVGAGATTAHANTNLDNREQVVQTSAPSLAEHGDGGGGGDRVPATGDEATPPPGTGFGGGRSNPAPVSCELLVETSLQRGETPPADLVATGGPGMPASPPFMAPPAAVGNRSVGDGEKMGGNGYDTVDTGVEAAADGVYKVPQDDSTCRGRHPFLCGRRMLCCYAFVIVAVAIIVPSVLLTGGDGDDSSQNSAERVASFSEILAPISPTVQESGTPQNKALNWLATEDPAQLPSDGDVDRIVQRYVLACLYYSTNGEDWGDQLYFLSGDHECRWNEWNKEAGFLNGVTCYEGRVDYLMLPNNGLEGTIPSELQELSSMTRLALNSNLLSSTIPPELFNLTSLEHLGLQFNQLVGPISTHIGSLPDLTELNLSANSFNDTIPDSLGNLTKLELLVLHSNRFTGRVPDSFHNLESLETLHLYGNSVTGNVTYMCDMGVNEITADCFEVACSCPSCDCF